jgi:hypothetical protein
VAALCSQALFLLISGACRNCLTRVDCPPKIIPAGQLII